MGKKRADLGEMRLKKKVKTPGEKYIFIVLGVRAVLWKLCPLPELKQGNEENLCRLEFFFWFPFSMYLIRYFLAVPIHAFFNEQAAIQRSSDTTRTLQCFRQSPLAVGFLVIIATLVRIWLWNVKSALVAEWLLPTYWQLIAALWVNLSCCCCGSVAH